MEKTQEILKHLFDLYNETEYTEEEILHWCEGNKERYQAWQDAFAEYDLADVFQAIDDYWRYNSNKTKPTVAKILATLTTNKAKRTIDDGQPSVKYFNPAVEFMQRDINLGRCTHTINAYNHAVAYILHERLAKELPMAVYAKMDFSQMVKEAKDKGLFDDFEEVLEALANKQQPAELPKGDENFGSVGAILAGHWGTD